MATEGFTFEQVVSLEGELLVEDSIKIKQMLGSDAFIFRYSNDVMNYIPSSTVFKEGGYERDPVSMIYGLPAK
jgi:neutral ceramidase